MRISAREACVKPHLRTLSDINILKGLADFTVLTRNNIDHAITYISVQRAHE